MTLVTFGQYLQIKREALKMTRDESARRLGISGQTLMNWENDKYTPKLPMMKRLMKNYNMTQEEIAPYNIFEEPTAKVSFKLLIENMNHLQSKLNRTMTGASKFESNLKNNAIDKLIHAIEIIQPFAVIDEGM